MADLKAELIRVETGKKGSFGVWLWNGETFCVTLELPYRQNRKNVSCIPAGTYQCVLTPSPLVERITKGKWKQAYEITGIPNRSRVLVHPGNLVEDTEGCVLAASSYGKLKGERAVLNSGATFDSFMTFAAGRPFTLTVREVDLTPEYPVV